MTARPILLGTPHDIEPGDLWRPTVGTPGQWYDYNAAARTAWIVYFDEFRTMTSDVLRNPHLVEIVKGAA